MASRLAFAAMAVFLVVVMQTYTFGFAASPTTSTVNTRPQLRVTVSPPALPTDGGTYHSVYVEIQTAKGDPLAAPENVTVTLTSSVLEVGSIDPTVVIPEGETYAVAAFSTTLTSGSTNVTASSSGMMTSSAKITTISPSGSAVKLGVFPAPPTLLPQVGSTGAIFVQLLDAGGRPARAPSTLSVALASSNPSVANVSQRITIRKGQTYGTATVTVASIAGATTITASTSGFATGFAQLNVAGQNPSRLYVKVAPDYLAPSTGEQAVVAIQLQSRDGTPTPAPRDILVHVTSSNTTVGILIGADITIKSGRSYATTGFLALVRGTSVISATTQSYASGFFVVTVVKAGNTFKGGSLALIPALRLVLPNRESYPGLVAQLRNSTGAPSYAPSNAVISLASSNILVGTTDDLLVIRAGRTFSAAYFYSTLAPGVANITASASNFVSASTLIVSAGPIPSRIAVVPGPSILIANGSAYSTTAVQLQDVAGNPAKAPTNIIVTLTSSSADVGDVVRAVTIPAGTAHAYVTFYSTLIAGITTITATAPGYVSGQATITTIPPAQSRLALYYEPQKLPADGLRHNTLTVELQDQGSLPAKAVLPMNVTLASSNPAVVDVQPRIEIPVGSTFAVANLTLSNTNGTATITAQTPGLTSASLVVGSVVLPLHASIRVVSNPPILTLSPVKLQLNVTSGPYPVANAKVTWSTDSRAAKITSASSSTDAKGGTSALVNFAEAGNVTVTALISKGGYGERLVSAKVAVQLQTLLISVIPDSIDIGAGGSTAITALVTSAGKPVAGVPISWATTSGTIDPSLSLTDAQGAAKVTFKSSAGGLANITASANPPGYSSADQTVQITMETASSPTGLTGLIIPAVAIVAVGLALFFLWRRGILRLPKGLRPAKKEQATTEEAEEGEEEEE